MQPGTSARAWQRGWRAGSMLAATWLMLLAGGMSEAQASEEAPALAFVTSYRIGSNLPSLASSAARQTQTYASLSDSLGGARARGLVEEEIARLVPRYRTRWDQLLAAVYAKHFSSAELLSLSTEGPRSQHTIKLAALQPLLGSDMQESSRELLMELVREALERAGTRPASARQRTQF